MVQRITPFLWFDTEAEEAANFYVSIFGNSRITAVTYYDKATAEAAGGTEGSVLTVEFQLEGQDFVALNGGPGFPFSQAVSFMVLCDTQEEIDRLWAALSEGGEEIQCGWLKDRYGLPWQITPTVMMQMMKDKDPAKAQRAMQAMMQMVKFDIAALQKAFDGAD